VYRIFKLLVVCGYENGLITLNGEHRLIKFEIQMLRGIFRLKKVEVIGGWRKIHNKEGRNFHASLYISILNKWKCDGLVRNTYNTFLRKSQGKRLLHTPGVDER
jgi:beta-galactosidase GanA